MQRAKRRSLRPVEFLLDAAERKLTGPDVDYTFPQVRYLALDSYTAQRPKRTPDPTIFRLSFVDKEADVHEEQLLEHTRQLVAPPKKQAKVAPPAPADGDLLIVQEPYELARTLARECSIALDLPLLDLTSNPPRLVGVEQQKTTLEGRQVTLEHHPGGCDHLLHLVRLRP